MQSYEQQFKSLADIGSINRGKSKHRPRNDHSLYGGDYPFIQTGDVKAAHFYLSSFSQTYNERGLAQSKLWQPGTLCITIAANIADTAILKIPACFPDSIIGFLPKANVADVRFVKYCLDTYKQQMQSISQGTTQDNLSQEKLLGIKFKIPSFQEQQKIAAVLSAYDDLIENNRRRIELLERMAEELYREWFVRFRFPGYQQAKFHKGLPAEWELKKLKDILELCYGKALKEEQRQPGDFPVYGSSGVVGFHNKALVDGPGIIVGRKGNVGRIHWADTGFFPIDTAYFVKAKTSLHYIFFMLDGLNFINNDSAVPGLNREQAYSNPVILPPAPLVEKFEGVVISYFAKKKHLLKKNEILSEMRDQLLNRLISGKLPVDQLDIQFPPSMREADAARQEVAHA